MKQLSLILIAILALCTHHPADAASASDMAKINKENDAQLHAEINRLVKYVHDHNSIEGLTGTDIRTIGRNLNKFRAAYYKHYKKLPQARLEDIQYAYDYVKDTSD